MKTFKEQIAADNAAIFINDMEFADTHDLNGTECKAVVQDISVAEVAEDFGQAYTGIYGSRVQVNCLKESLPEVPVPLQVFVLDGKIYQVESCADDMGILTIQLAVHDR